MMGLEREDKQLMFDEMEKREPVEGWKERRDVAQAMG